MTDRPKYAVRLLPIVLGLAGLCMVVMSITLLINAAKLGIFVRMMLGFIGVVFVDSVILTFVTIRIAIAKEDDATVGEKAVLLALALCTGVGLAVV